MVQDGLATEAPPNFIHSSVAHVFPSKAAPSLGLSSVTELVTMAQDGLATEASPSFIHSSVANVFPSEAAPSLGESSVTKGVGHRASA